MRALFLVLASVLLLAIPAAGAEWGQIRPGTSTQAHVRARYGAPTRETPLKVDNYDTVQWSYEGPQAPTGINKMTVDFGLLTPSGYRKDVVRTFRIEPKFEVFNRKLVIEGWGPPSRVGTEGDLEFFLYEAGLLVYFDQDGRNVPAMIFTPPQKLPPATNTPPAVSAPPAKGTQPATGTPPAAGTLPSQR